MELTAAALSGRRDLWADRIGFIYICWLSPQTIEQGPLHICRVLMKVKTLYPGISVCAGGTEDRKARHSACSTPLCTLCVTVCSGEVRMSLTKSVQFSGEEPGPDSDQSNSPLLLGLRTPAVASPTWLRTSTPPAKLHNSSNLLERISLPWQKGMAGGWTSGQISPALVVCVMVKLSPRPYFQGLVKNDFSTCNLSASEPGAWQQGSAERAAIPFRAKGKVGARTATPLLSFANSKERNNKRGWRSKPTFFLQRHQTYLA